MPCGFWGDLGMANMPDEDKIKIWNWIFSLPADEIGLKHSIGIGIQISTAPINKADLFENQIEGYKKKPPDRQPPVGALGCSKTPWLAKAPESQPT